MSQRKRSKGLGYSQMTDGEDDSIPTQVERRSQDQVNQKVSELVQFLLVKDQKKIPIKRADMLKNIIREYRDAYTEIVRRADRTLQEVFGLQLVEIDTKRHIYILINNLPRAEGEHLCRKQHSVFGDVRKLVTEEFVRQKYLETTPIPLTDPPEFKYQWGPRAEKETSKKDVLSFVAKMQGKDPTFWASQYSEAEANRATT
ncbi:non-structural maintenance of chromosomes element 3 homolog isoform X4 [Passer montanus]|uniref:non-structural maintenance of chromosomes element 3 homolog isoform X4 n=1 Tax=Passer montanus TaxID=9160 RepID=UPI0019609A89|nr:non-structural maintenance of chromosomes element 3 homolog isoform X4 [Passer montanus]